MGYIVLWFLRLKFWYICIEKTPSQTFVHDGVFSSYSVFSDFSDKNITLCVRVFFLCRKTIQSFANPHLGDFLSVGRPLFPSVKQVKEQTPPKTDHQKGKSVLNQYAHLQGQLAVVAEIPKGQKIKKGVAKHRKAEEESYVKEPCAAGLLF